MSKKIWLTALALNLNLGYAQTQIDFPKQTRNLAGSSLPAACSAGQLFVNLSSPAGQNVYVCTTTNTWSLEAGGGGGGGGGGGSVPSYNVTTTSSAIAMGPGSVLTAANGVSVLAGTYTITHVTGTDSGTFYVGPNTSNQAVCYYSSGITLSNWTVAGFAGSTCTSGSPPADIYTVPISVVSGVVGSAPAQYQPVTNQVISQGTCIAVANNTTVSFTTSCQQTLTSVGFSSTPAFAYGSGVNTFEITLTGNVTSSSVSGATAGQIANFIVCQDGTGSRTFTWPSSFHGAFTIGSTASKCNAQSFAYDGSNYYAISAGVTNQ
jgi:hypothetical protein